MLATSSEAHEDDYKFLTRGCLHSGQENRKKILPINIACLKPFVHRGLRHVKCLPNYYRSFKRLESLEV